MGEDLSIEVLVLARSDLLAAVPQRMNLKYAEWEDAVTATPEGLA
jgi:hypothetical protein